HPFAPFPARRSSDPGFGYGKRSSSYDFRVIGRGGKGIRATDVSKQSEIGPLIAAFPIGHDDQIMLVTNGGQVIRVPVGGIRIASRATKGVKIFNTADGERVVSVEPSYQPQNGDAEEVEATLAEAVEIASGDINPEPRLDGGEGTDGTSEE